MKLKILIENAAELAEDNNTAFAMARRMGLGASDSSVILGVNPFNKLDDLIVQKCSRQITADEEKVGNMVAVRKGKDLEPIILQKFITQFNVDPKMIDKPSAMYQLTECPQLTVNFDALFQGTEQTIPIEIKYISMYGGKYYNFTKTTEFLTTSVLQAPQPSSASNDIAEYVKAMAEATGIPAYYYTQLQQQLLASGGSHGYLVALNDKTWDLNMFLVYRDERTIRTLITQSDSVWAEILNRRQIYGY